MGKDAMTCKEAITFWATNPYGEPVVGEDGTEQPPPKLDPATSEKVTLMCMLPSIKKMDNKLNDLKECTHLSLGTNQIDRIQPLDGLSKLKILSLGRNNIKKIEKLEGVSKTLEELWISYNPINKLDGLQSLTKLRVLFMSNNKLDTFDELLKLERNPALEELNLIGNPMFEDMSPTEGRAEVIRRLPKLKKLDGVLITELERQAALSAEH